MERLAALPPDGEWSRLLLTRREAQMRKRHRRQPMPFPSRSQRAPTSGPISLSPHKEMGERNVAQGKTLPYGFSLENPFPQSAKGIEIPLDPRGEQTGSAAHRTDCQQS